MPTSSETSKLPKLVNLQNPTWSALSRAGELLQFCQIKYIKFLEFLFVMQYNVATECISRLIIILQSTFIISYIMVIPIIVYYDFVMLIPYYGYLINKNHP